MKNEVWDRLHLYLCAFVGWLSFCCCSTWKQNDSHFPQITDPLELQGGRIAGVVNGSNCETGYICAATGLLSIVFRCDRSTSYSSTGYAAISSTSGLLMPLHHIDFEINKAFAFYLFL